MTATITIRERRHYVTWIGIFTNIPTTSGVRASADNTQIQSWTMEARIRSPNQHHTLDMSLRYIGDEVAALMPERASIVHDWIWVLSGLARTPLVVGMLVKLPSQVT